MTRVRRPGWLSRHALDTAQAVWRRVPSTVRRGVLFAGNDRFLLGVVGLVADPHDRLLLLRHRFRTPWPLGLPGGFVAHGETLEGALARELAEEVGLVVSVEPDPFDVELHTTMHVVSVTLLARTEFGANVGQHAKTHPVVPRTAEILSGQFYARGALPPDVYPAHLKAIDRYWEPPLSHR